MSTNISKADPVDNMDLWLAAHPHLPGWAVQCRYLRVKNGIEIDQMANAIGCCKSGIERVERGDPRAEKTAHQILKHFQERDPVFVNLLRAKSMAEAGFHGGGRLPSLVTA